MCGINLKNKLNLGPASWSFSLSYSSPSHAGWYADDPVIFFQPRNEAILVVEGMGITTSFVSLPEVLLWQNLDFMFIRHHKCSLSDESRKHCHTKRGTSQVWNYSISRTVIVKKSELRFQEWKSSSLQRLLWMQLALQNQVPNIYFICEISLNRLKRMWFRGFAKDDKNCFATLPSPAATAAVASQMQLEVPPQRRLSSDWNLHMQRGVKGFT